MNAPTSITQVDTSGATDTLTLARVFHRSADELIEGKVKDKPWGPFRVLAVQAIELYLNAYLLRHGLSKNTLKSMQHDFAKRAEFSCAIGLNLKSGTVKHLRDLTNRNEYVAARYDAYVQQKFSEPNRITATLVDIASKVDADFE